MKLKLTLLLAFTFVCTLGVYAQDSEVAGSSMASPKDFNRWSIGLSGGSTVFQGDLSPFGNGDGIKFHPVYGGNLTYRVSHSVGIRLNGWLGEFAGENLTKSGLTREDFTSDFWQSDLNLVFTLGNISHLNRNKKFHIEGNVGLGLIKYDSKLEQKIPSILTKERNVAEGIIQGGIGAKYALGSKMNLGLFYQYNRMFNDDLDLSTAGFSDDAYSFVTLGLNYTLGGKEKNMEWINPMEIVYNDMADMRGKMDMLSNDKDNDGVADIFDKDNSTPEGSKVYGDGTALDTDGDGVTDVNDSDPFTPKGVTVDANGVAVDSDGDGVPDGKDLEANTPAGTLVNFQGITIPKFDPSMIPANTGVTLPSIYFATNSSVVTSAYNQQLLTVARAMQANPSLRLLVSGNADKTGGEEYNQTLAQKRADNTIAKLVDLYGVDASRLSTVSNGETTPMTEKINSVNRRVDFTVQ